jgi:hypothetical protein
MELGERVEALLASSVLAAPELTDAEVLAELRREVLAGRLLLLADAWALHGRISGCDALLYVAAARSRMRQPWASWSRTSG